MQFDCKNGCMGIHQLDYAANILKVISALGGVSLLARLLTGFRRYRNCTKPSTQCAGYGMIVYSIATIYGAAAGIITHVHVNWPVLTYLFLMIGMILGHVFIGLVEEETTPCDTPRLPPVDMDNL